MFERWKITYCNTSTRKAHICRSQTPFIVAGFPIGGGWLLECIIIMVGGTGGEKTERAGLYSSLSTRRQLTAYKRPVKPFWWSFCPPLPTHLDLLSLCTWKAGWEGFKKEKGTSPKFPSNHSSITNRKSKKEANEQEINEREFPGGSLG